MRIEKKAGRDPFQMFTAARAEPASKTFAEALTEYLKIKEPTWKASSRARERRDHERTFGEIPDFTALLVKDIDQAAKSKALAKLGSSARRKAKSWIGAVIRFAETGEIRERGGNDEVEHHAAMSYGKVPGFYTRLSEVGTVDARALQWTILTGARTDEVIGAEYKGQSTKAPATWGEITEVDGLPTWVIGADRMKATKVHRVPLTAAAVALLGERQADDVPLFKVRHQNAMLNLLQSFDGCSEYTVHGMRSSFEDWAAETTDFPRDLVKLCTAHDKRTKVDKAYQRSDLLKRRREIMQAWSDYVSA
jgi:integrase